MASGDFDPSSMSNLKNTNNVTTTNLEPAEASAYSSGKEVIECVEPVCIVTGIYVRLPYVLRAPLANWRLHIQSHWSSVYASRFYPR